MWLNQKGHDAAPRLMATRWNLKIDALAAKTRRAFVYHVVAPKGPAALKLYKRIGGVWRRRNHSILA
ncbi:hypothetical protein ACJ5NV_14005 [Loktanella agnita]|uniref:hypothetical protein n=1 Tax=Loktanella agnita TaxID=287097 RepID=UPI00398599EF